MDKIRIREALETMCRLLHHVAAGDFDHELSKKWADRSVKLRDDALAALDDDGWDTDIHTETVEVTRAEDLVKELTRLRAENESLQKENESLRANVSILQDEQVRGWRRWRR